MALVSGGRSTLNPNAPVFIPAALRQVEDFSQEWWDLVTTSTWFRDYWLSQNQGEDGFFGNDEEDGLGGNDVVDLLPDTIDVGSDEDYLNFEAQYEEFIQFSESGNANKFSSSAVNGMPENGLAVDAEALIRSLSISKSGKERGPKSPMGQAKYWEKSAKCASPKRSPRIIQQPR